MIIVFWMLVSPVLLVSIKFAYQGRSQGGGGSLGSEELPRQRKVHQLECTKRSTITVSLINNAAYYYRY